MSLRRLLMASLALASLAALGGGAEAQSRYRSDTRTYAREAAADAWRERLSYRVEPNRVEIDQSGRGLAIQALQRGVAQQIGLTQRGVNDTALINQAGSLSRVWMQQSGNDLTGSIYQNGNGNFVGVAQIGEGHTATTVQEGNGNLLGVIQIGNGQYTTYQQIGDGNADLVIQFGWDK